MPEAPKRCDFPIDLSWRVMLMDLGINVDELLERTELPVDTFSRPGNRLAAADYFRLWNSVQIAIKHPAAPLLIAQAAVRTAFEPSVFSALCSPNLKVAFERLARYKRLFAPMRLQLFDQRRGFKVVFDWSTVTGVPSSLIATELAFFVALARHATRHKVVPLRVETNVAMTPVRTFQQFWGIAPTTTRINALTFSRSDVTRPFFTENEAMWNVFEPELRRRLATVDEHASTKERVRSVLLDGLPSGQASIVKVARRLSVSPRTLQRQLQREHISFQAVVNQTRSELAIHYLTNTQHTSSEISFLLGYADPNSFFRAFAEWTGKTPQQARSASAV
jgi:AraC-like DNA-binding protein